MCHCGNMGMEQTLNKSQHTKLALEKKILLLLAAFQSGVWYFTNKLTWLLLLLLDQHHTQVQQF